MRTMTITKTEEKFTEDDFYSESDYMKMREWKNKVKEAYKNNPAEFKKAVMEFRKLTIQ